MHVNYNLLTWLNISGNSLGNVLQHLTDSHTKKRLQEGSVPQRFPPHIQPFIFFGSRKKKKTRRHVLDRLKNQCGCVVSQHLVTLLQIPMPFYSDFGNLCETIPMPPSALEFGGHLCSTPYKITRLTAVLHFFKIPLNPETITLHNTSSSLNS